VSRAAPQVVAQPLRHFSMAAGLRTGNGPALPCLFVRDGQTRRFLFNVKALQALGINAVEARQRGYPIKEQPPMAEAEEDLTAA
jgi:hypothetical protein